MFGKDIITILLGVVFLFYSAYVLFRKAGSESNEPVVFGKEQTDTVKGIAAIIILIHHFSLGNEISGLHRIIHKTYGNMGAMGVGIFLFISGYCLQYNMANKPDYIKRIPGKILKLYIVPVWVWTIIAIFSRENILNCFLIWNKSWFFAFIIAAFAIYYLCARLFSQKVTLSLMLFFTVVYWIVAYTFGIGVWCYNTAFNFVAGLFFYQYNHDKSWRNNFACDKRILVGLAVINGLLYVTQVKLYYIIPWGISSTLFDITSTALIVYIMLVRPCVSNFLQFVGKYAFEMLIIQIDLGFLDKTISPDRVDARFVQYLICVVAGAILVKRSERICRFIVDKKIIDEQV